MTWLGRLFSALLGGVNPLRDGLAALWQAACRNPWQALLVLALGAAGVLGWMLHHEREDNARLRADIAEIAKSQRQAARDQAAINHAPAAISQAIAKLAAVLALPMLMLTGCGHRPLSVRPATPICAEPIVLPRSMTEPVPMVSWLRSLPPISTSVPRPASALPRCTPMPKP